MDDNTIERLILAIARWEPTVNHSALRYALREFDWGGDNRIDPHPLLPYARAVADKLRETWPWHTFSDEMLLGVLETGKPGDPSAREMAIRLADKLNLGDSMVEPIAVALRYRGWDGSAPLAVVVEQRPDDVLHFPDPRRQRIEAFAMHALQGICASGPSSYFTNDRLADEAWALGQAMVDQEPK